MQRKRDTPDRHQQQSNDGQDTYISNQSNDNASDNEFYFADEETKTETETTTKIDIDKTIKTKTTATPNADTTTAIKSAAEKMRHTRLSNDNASDNEFILPARKPRQKQRQQQR